MKVLVTGAAGFIGSHLVEHLIKNTDWEIIILDKLTYASNGMSRLNDVKAFTEHKDRVRIFATDLTQEISWGIKNEIGNVDYIIHMAAETHVDNAIVDPWPFIQSNVIGTYRMLEFARGLSSLQKFIYFSTDEVFGPAPANVSFKEWDRYNSTNPYSATKAAGEELCLAWANTYNIPGMCITHTMNNFGERQHPEKFIPLVVKKVLAGQTIHIHADTSKKKSGSRFYIHARNTADAIMFLLAKSDLGVRDKFNIVGELEVSNMDLVGLIHNILEDITGRHIPLKAELVDFHGSRPGHDLRYALDGGKMKGMGWAPPNTFIESLEKTVRWMVAPENSKWLFLTKQASI